MEKKNEMNVSPFISKTKTTINNLVSSIDGLSNILEWNYSNGVLQMVVNDSEKLSLKPLQNDEFIKEVKQDKLKLIITFTIEFNSPLFVKELNKEIKMLKNNVASGKNRKKFSFKDMKNKIFEGLSAILIPCVPVMTLSGIIQGLYAVFTQTGVLKGVEINYDDGIANVITDSGIVSGLFYILGQMGMGFCGVYFCYTTVTYLKGNGVMGCLVGLTMATPMLFPDLQWNLFSIGDNIEIGIKSYSSSIICQVGAGFLYVHLDRLLKKIVPESIEVIFRHTFAYVFCIIPMFIVIGPFLNIVENGIGYGLSWVGGIPFGIGLTLFTFLFGFTILMGMGLVIFTLVILSLDPNLGSLLYVAITIPSLAQAGAAIAIGVKTRNENTRRIAFNLITPGLLNSTEAVVYGITFPKGRPFFMGCIASGIAGLMIYIFDVRVYSVAGGGIFANWLSFIKGGYMNVFWYFVVQFSAIGLGFILTFPVYRERISEKELTIKNNKEFFKELSQLTGKDIKQLLREYSSSVKELMNFFDKKNAKKIKHYEKIVSKKQKDLFVLISLIHKEEAIRIKLLNKITFYKNNNNIEKARIFTEKLGMTSLNNKILLAKEKVIISENIFVNEKIEFVKLQKEYSNSVNSFLGNFNLKDNKDIFDRYNEKSIKIINSIYHEYNIE